jgi:hypothetical protein
MNYAAHYQRLIERARVRILTGYREKHHATPRCLGGSDAAENIVHLTAEEHFVAHQLLVKMHPEVRGLAIALMLMSRDGTKNKLYGWLRRRASGAMLGNTRSLGKKYPPRSEEWRAAKSAALRGRSLPLEQRAKIGRSQLGKIVSAETRKRMSAALKGLKRSPETRARISAAMSGVKRPPRSVEHRAKIAASKLGKKRPFRTPEWRANHAAAVRAAWAKKKESGCAA